MPRSVPVLIDATAIPSRLGGVGRYLEGLVTGLSETDARFAVVVRREHHDHFARLAPGATIVLAPTWTGRTALRLLWEQLFLPRVAKGLGARVLHSPHYTRPVLWRGPRVVTLHDATFFSDPDRHGRLKRLFFSFWTIRALRDGRTVCIVPSAATASELRRHVPRTRSTVRVSLHGVDLTTFRSPRESESADLRELVGLPTGARWIAFLGTIEPRKNLSVLLRAHQDLRATDSSTPDLLVAGGRGWDHAALSLLDSLTPEDGVHALGYLPVDALPALLGGADVVAYPSSAEGFGLPVLEAMATGACVLTTPYTAIPEVGGDAVAYVEPTRRELADALRSLLTDAPRRLRLGEAGQVRARTFTWSRTAGEHIGAYEGAQ